MRHSWELGRWPVGHLRLQSTTRTGATKPRSPAPLCPLRPGPCTARLSARLTALLAARVASGPRALRLGVASPAYPAAHFSPSLSCPPRPSLLTLFSGLITFRIKAKPSPGCEYNAPRASRGEERGAETSRGQQQGWRRGGGGGWWDVTRLQQVSALGCSTVTSQTYFFARCSPPKPRLPGGRGGVEFRGGERSASPPAVCSAPRELRGSPTP